MGKIVIAYAPNVPAEDMGDFLKNGLRLYASAYNETPMLIVCNPTVSFAVHKAAAALALPSEIEIVGSFDCPPSSLWLESER